MTNKPTAELIAFNSELRETCRLVKEKTAIVLEGGEGSGDTVNYLVSAAELVAHDAIYLADRLAELEAALKHYANPENYQPTVTLDSMPSYTSYKIGQYFVDGEHPTDVAQQALQPMAEGEDA